MREVDTTVEARQIQIDAYRAMSAIDRLRHGFALSDDVRRMADAGVTAREPHRPQS